VLRGAPHFLQFIGISYIKNIPVFFGSKALLGQKPGIFSIFGMFFLNNFSLYEGGNDFILVGGQIFKGINPDCSTLQSTHWTFFGEFSSHHSSFIHPSKSI